MSNSLLLDSMVGEYRLIDFLGEGGMGEVYRGVHAKLGRVAAVKVLNASARREQGFVERFFNEALRIFASLADAIAYVHSHGVIHRDIKSNNVKISTQGAVKLLDFGIAKGGASPALTQTGSVVGTIEYLSPEQLSTGHADQRSDIWALGVLLYEMLTGRVPFQATTIGALCAQISNAEYPPLRQLNPAAPASVEQIVSRCLKKNA